MTNLFRFGLVLQHRNMDGDVECAFLSADSIEANVENAEVHVERGAEQLQRAAPEIMDFPFVALPNRAAV